MIPANENIIKVSEAFSKQAAIFDKISSGNKLTAHLRAIFRAEVEKHLAPQSRILELNCGSGIDSVYFAYKGHDVLATDNAPGMLEILESKIAQAETKGEVKTLRCSYHDLHKIDQPGFDHIISNFGGLNCTSDLKHVLQQFAPLLKEKGKVTLVLMPKVCPWEIAMALKGKFKTAFRRFRKQTPAHIEGVHFSCYYYNPSYIINELEDDFNVKTLKGIFISVPPEFYHNFVERYPAWYKLLSRIDRTIGGYFPFNRLCDHFMITLEKK